MTKLAAVAANFTRDLEQNYALIESLARQARDEDVDFLVLPEAAIGGYLSSLGNHGDTVKTTSKSLPPAIRVDGPETRPTSSRSSATCSIAIGFCELDDDGETRYNAAAVLDGGTVYGTYRKVHQPLGEGMSYSAGSDYGVFEHPGRPGGAADLLRQGISRGSPHHGVEGRGDHREPLGVACGAHCDAPRTCRTTAGPTDSTSSTRQGHWTIRSSGSPPTRAGNFGSLRYVGNAKVVDPGGNTLATTLLGSGMAVAEVDVDETFSAMRAGMFHLRDRRPDVYGPVTEATGSDLAHA